MTGRVTLSLNNESYNFLKKVAQNNMSAYINSILQQEQQRMLAEAILAANIEEAEDIEYQKELSDWDVTLSDGLN